MKIEHLHSIFLKCDSITTDTRKIGGNSMYFALKGEHFNGNSFAEQALQNGASFAVVDEPMYVKDEKYLLVDNVLETLQALASFHRETLQIPVIAVTGSNGKTTTKELLNVVLSKKYKVAYTKGNLNNHIGVPLTLLDITQSHEIALIEMGDNHPKEVQFLCDIARPNFGFVTNVGKDHLEGFGSFEKNILAKKEIFDFLEAQRGIAFVDFTDKLVSGMVSPGLNVVGYGEPNSFSFIEFTRANPVVVFKDELGKSVSTNLFGAFNFENIKLAYCIGKYFEVPLDLISQALSEYQPDNNRSQVIDGERNTLVMDAYNANPSSVHEALKSFSEMETAKPKWVVLGDMFELGSYSEEEHRNIAHYAAQQNFEELIFIGKNYAMVNKATNRTFFSTKEEAEVYLKKIAPEGAIILLKGSRGMRLESLQPLL